MELSQKIAEVMIARAREDAYVTGPLAVIEELADWEKNIFLFMFKEVEKYLSYKKERILSADEIVSLFTYIFAKAGEAVTTWYNGQEFTFDAHGMFDGKVPMYNDERLLQYFKTVNLPADLADAFGKWNSQNADLCAKNNIDPILPLFEALKWTWRITVNHTIEYLEQLGFKFEQ
jgi:hypothetical protein